MVKVSEKIRRFLEEFEEACRKRGGTVDKGVSLDYRYVTCRFEGSPPTVRVYAKSYLTPDREWTLSICIDTLCADARELDVLRITPAGESLFKEKKLCGYMDFDGIYGLSGPETRLAYVFRPEYGLGLKEIRIYAKKDEIDVDLVQ
jgi:hypothetical protein